MATLGEQAVGSIVKLNESGSPVEFIVVQQGSPSAAYVGLDNGTILLRKDIHSKGIYDYTENDYANSDLHGWCNGAYLALLDEDVRNQILQIKIPYCPGTSGVSVSDGEDGLSCKIFILSTREVDTTPNNSLNEGSVFSYFSGGGNTKRLATYNGETTAWWLRSPIGGFSEHAFRIAINGDAAGGRTVDVDYLYGRRPTFALPNTTIVLDDGTITTNNPPTAPGSIDVTGVAAGGTATITLTAATDTDGTIASYIYERSVDAGAWTQFADVNSLTQTDSISEDWGTVAYRACAKDNLGATGPYITSETKTVNSGWLTIGGPDPALGQRSRPFTLTAGIGATGATGVTGIATKTYLDNVLKSSGTVNQGAEISEFVDVRTMSSGSHTLQFVAEHEDYLSATKAWQFTVMGDALPDYGKAEQLYNDAGAPIFPKTTTQQVIGPNGLSVQNEIEKIEKSHRGITGHLAFVDAIYNKSGVEIAREANTVYAFRHYMVWTGAGTAAMPLIFVAPADTNGTKDGVTIAADKFTIDASNAIIEVYKYVLDMVEVAVQVDPATQFETLTQPKLAWSDWADTADEMTVSDLDAALEALLEWNTNKNNVFYQYKVKSVFDSNDYYVLARYPATADEDNYVIAWVSSGEPTKVHGFDAVDSSGGSYWLILKDTSTIESEFAAVDSNLVLVSTTTTNSHTGGSTLNDTLAQMAGYLWMGDLEGLSAKYKIKDEDGTWYYLYMSAGTEITSGQTSYSVKAICSAAGTYYTNETITIEDTSYSDYANNFTPLDEDKFIVRSLGNQRSHTVSGNLGQTLYAMVSSISGTKYLYKIKSQVKGAYVYVVTNSSNRPNENDVSYSVLGYCANAGTWYGINSMKLSPYPLMTYAEITISAGGFKTSMYDSTDYVSEDSAIDGLFNYTSSHPYIYRLDVSGNGFDHDSIFAMSNTPLESFTPGSSYWNCVAVQQNGSKYYLYNGQVQISSISF